MSLKFQGDMWNKLNSSLGKVWSPVDVPPCCLHRTAVDVRCRRRSTDETRELLKMPMQKTIGGYVSWCMDTSRQGQITHVWALAVQ
jgi:hypothetical protein